MNSDRERENVWKDEGINRISCREKNRWNPFVIEKENFWRIRPSHMMRNRLLPILTWSSLIISSSHHLTCMKNWVKGSSDTGTLPLRRKVSERRKGGRERKERWKKKKDFWDRKMDEDEVRLRMRKLVSVHQVKWGRFHPSATSHPVHRFVAPPNPLSLSILPVFPLFWRELLFDHLHLWRRWKWWREREEGNE